MKRLLSLLLCLSMVLSMMPVSAFAEETEETIVPAETEAVPETTVFTETAVPETTAAPAQEETEAPPIPETTLETTREILASTEPVQAAEEALDSEAEQTYILGEPVFFSELELPDSDELFAGYVEQQFYGGGITPFGIAAGSLLTGNTKLIYDGAVTAIRQIAEGSRDYAEFSIGQSASDYPVDKELEKTLTGSALNEEELKSMITTLLRALLADLPYELYWADKTAGVGINQVYTGSGKLVQVILSFTVSQDYLSPDAGTNKYLLDTSKTSAAAASAANAQEIVAKYQDALDYNKLLAYKDEICSLVSYNKSAASNTSTPYGDPWQLIYVFDGDDTTNVVCEGYSKAFQYLCDLSAFDLDILCHSVTGTIPTGDHMWNIVSVEGKNYLVDVTNSDSGTAGSKGQLFLAGGSGSISSGYTFANVKFRYNTTATATWGTGENSILKLDTKKLTYDTFPLSAMGSFQKMLEDDGEATLSTELTLTRSFTIPRDMTIAGSGRLIVPRGITLTIPAGVTVTNLGALEILSGGRLVLSGTVSQTMPEIAEGGTISGSGTFRTSVSTLAELNALLDPALPYGGLEILLAAPVTLDADLTIPKKIFLDITGVSLTVAAPAVLANQGAISLGRGGSLIVERTAAFTGNAPQLTADDAVFEDRNILTQKALEALLASESTVTLPHGLTLTGDLTIPESTTLAVSGPEAALTIPEGITLTNLGALEAREGGTVTVTGTLSGNVPEADSGSSVSGTGAFRSTAGTLEEFQTVLNCAELYGSVQLQLSASMTLEQNVTIPENAVLDITGVSLTVAVPAVLANQGAISLGRGGSLIVERTAAFTGNAPQLTADDAVFEDRNILTQKALEALLASESSVTLPHGLILTSDLTIPADKTLVVGGPEAALTIPEGITLTNLGALEAREGGTVTVTGTLSGNVPEADSGSSVSGTGAFRSTVSTPEELEKALDCAGQYGDVQLQLGASMTLEQSVTIPENATLELKDVQLTVTGNVSLNNQGVISLGGGSSLTLQDGAALEGAEPDITSPDAVFEDKNPLTQEMLEALLALQRDVNMTKSLTLTGDLTIPEGKTLVIAGKDIFLTIPEGITLVNLGQIRCVSQGGILSSGGALENRGHIHTENQGILDMTAGAFRSADEGTLVQHFRVSPEEVFVTSTILGVSSEDITVEAQRLGEAQLLELLASFSADAPKAMTLLVSRDLTLTKAVTLPDWATMTVLEGMTLTVDTDADLTVEGRIRLQGQLVLKGTVDADVSPIHIIGGRPEVEEDQLEAYLRSNFLLTEGKLPAFVFPGLAPSQIHCDLPSGEGTQEDPVIAGTGTIVPITVTSAAPIGTDVIGFYYAFQILEGEAQLLADLFGDGFEPYPGEIYFGSQVQLRSETPGQVVLRITPTDTNFQRYGSEYARDIVISFRERHLEATPGGQQFQMGSAWGLWAGSAMTLAPKLLDEAGAEMPGAIFYSIDGGTPQKFTEALTLTAPEDLTEEARTTVTFTAEGVDPLETVIVMKPVITQVDVVRDGAVITDQTVPLDLGGEARQAALSAVITPAGAFLEDAGRIRWITSDEDIASVDDSGTVTFTGRKTGEVTITVTADFGAEKTASVTFDVVNSTLALQPHEDNPYALIGGSKGTFLALAPDGTALKTRDVQWFLCDEEGRPVDTNPYASITEAGRLTTKAVADPYVVYLMAKTETSSLLEPAAVTLYPAVSSAVILEDKAPVSGTLSRDISEAASKTFSLNWSAAAYAEAVKDVSWKSSSKKTAEIDADTGAVTVKAPGTVTFTLTVTALNGKTTKATVKYKFAAFTQALTIDGPAAVTVGSGDSHTFTASAVPSEVTTAGHRWKLSHKNAGTITAKGVFKAKKVSNPTTVELTAVSKDGYCISEPITITVMPKEDALVLYRMVGDERVYVTKTTQTATIGDKLVLGASENVTWTSSRPSYADFDDSGALVAKANGTTTITAAGAEGKASFTLKIAKLSSQVAVSVKNGAQPLVASGKSLSLTASVTYNDGTRDSKVTWSMAESPLATLSSSGKLTAAKKLTAGGTVTVTATAKDGSACAAIDVQIVPAATALEIWGPFSGADLDVTNTTQTLDLNTQAPITLSARVFPTGSQQSVTWKSSNARVAEIDSQGTLTCLKPGSTTITATAKDGSNKKATFKITVLKAARSLTLPKIAFVGGGKSLALGKLAELDPDATVQKLNWSMTMVSGNAQRPVPSSVATLSSSGTLKTKAADEPVTLCVRARTTDGSSLTALCTVTVYPAAKGVTVHSASGDDITRDTLPLAASGSVTLFPDTTNARGYGPQDDGTADEYLSAKDAWTITASRAGLTWDGSKQGQITVTVEDPEALSGKTVKLTVKANDGTGKSNYVKFKIS